MKIDEFLRLFPLRAPNIMWFLGAGASAAGGVPTAWDMLWEFKRLLYCTANKVTVKACGDLGDSIVRARLQRWLDSRGTFPPDNSDDEYSAYFEAAYPAERDRRAYLDQKIASGSASYGHRALAALFALGKTRIVWTTNFDTLVEDAAVGSLKSIGKLTVATLDRPILATHALNESRAPLLVKLHGDFRSERLKNTSEELRAQDAEFRRALVDACRRSGLAVCGFSGRDKSIMDTLTDGIDEGRGYPNGLFWFHRSDAPPLPRVRQLLEDASRAGIQAEAVEVETFDELFGDMIRALGELPEELAALLPGKTANRVSNAPVPTRGRNWPVIRLNALPISAWPTTCRRVACDIGGTKEVREAVSAAQVDMLVARRSVGVLIFGRDEDVRKTFGPHGIREFDLHSIEVKRLRYESAELGMLYEAIGRALTRGRFLDLKRRGADYRLVVSSTNVGDDCFSSLKKVTGALAGQISGTDYQWAEALAIRLEFRLDQLWLLLRPTIWWNFGGSGEKESPNSPKALRAKEFIRARLSGRFNPAWHRLLDAWIDILLGEGVIEGEFRAFGIGDGVDAVFKIGRTTGFTRRGG